MFRTILTLSKTYLKKITWKVYFDHKTHKLIFTPTLKSSETLESISWFLTSHFLTRHQDLVCHNKRNHLISLLSILLCHLLLGHLLICICCTIHIQEWSHSLDEKISAMKFSAHILNTNIVIHNGTTYYLYLKRPQQVPGGSITTSRVTKSSFSVLGRAGGNSWNKVKITEMHNLLYNIPVKSPLLPRTGSIDPPFSSPLGSRSHPSWSSGPCTETQVTCSWQGSGRSTYLVFSVLIGLQCPKRESPAESCSFESR